MILENGFWEHKHPKVGRQNDNKNQKVKQKKIDFNPLIMQK